MKGLFIKDSYVITKQLRLFLLVMLIFSALPSSGMYSYPLIYMSMLPVTALAYDEQTKWNELAGTMPYSRFQLVFSKYLIGYAALLFAIVVTLLIRLIVGALTGSTPDSDTFVHLFIISCASLLLMAILIPLAFRFGVEKGRFVFILLIVIVAVLLTNETESTQAVMRFGSGLGTAFLPALLAIVAAANFLSVGLCAKFYSVRK